MGTVRRLIGWAACLPSAASAGVASLRSVEGVEALVAADTLWLTGRGTDEEIDEALRRVPGLCRFDRLGGDRLAPSGRLLPDRGLPDGDWRPLRELLALAPQPAALAARVDQRVPLLLASDPAEREPGGLLLPRERLAAWVAVAPAVRLGPLRFAADETGRALVLGRPLPPLPGRRLTEIDGLLLPAGRIWSPAVEAGVVRRLLGLAPEELALLEPDGWERIPAEGLVPLTRSAVRSTR